MFDKHKSQSGREPSPSLPRLSRVGWLVALPFAVTACGGILEDTSFDDWCGDELCAWSLDDGQIRKVSTWHKRDHGVELVGDSVVLSQLTDSQPSCVQIALIGSVGPGATLTVEIDFDDNGISEYVAQVPILDWEQAKFVVNAPTNYNRARYIIRKEGAASVTLAHLEATEMEACGGTPIELQGFSADVDATTVYRELGEDCLVDRDCSSGSCHPGTEACSLCESDDDCPSGELCQLAADGSHHACEQ